MTIATVRKPKVKRPARRGELAGKTSIALAISSTTAKTGALEKKARALSAASADDLQAMRDRVRKALSSVTMNTETLRERVAMSKQWEEENPPVGSFSGRRLARSR